ncbi:MAG: dUTP diphosphatase [Flavobacteriaceae bacterium]|nr:dUTP diphosphatase [Flavobacteriaceae bacterium]
MKIKIVNTSSHPLPQYKTEDAAGMDLFANISDAIVLRPMERALIPTGLFLEIPKGFEAQVRPRSGLALKYGITCLNSPGTIDADYRGEVGVILANLSQEEFTIQNGDRIAQLVVAAYTKVEWELSEELSHSERGSGGFGSTGK